MANKTDKKGNVTFREVKAMYENGMSAISARTLDAAHAYKVVTFKTRLKNAYNELIDRQEALAKEAGIDDLNSFFRRLRELGSKAQRSEAEETDFKDLSSKNDTFNSLLEKLMDDNYEIEPKTMPYEEWRKLQDENKDIKLGNFELLAHFETTTEGILWKAPEGAE